MLLVFGFIFLVAIVKPSLTLPNGCADMDDRVAYEVISCSGGDFTEIVEFLSEQNKTLSNLIIENCSPVIPKITKLPKLYTEVLKINNCGIEEVEDGAFENVLPVMELDLSNNLIKKFPNTEFSLLKCEILRLNNNKMSHVPEGVFRKHNDDCGVDDILCSNRLYLKNNEISELPDSAFDGMIVDRIHLNDNQISNISPNAFKNFKVSTLHLQNNKITKLIPGTFDNIEGLMSLQLNNNLLSEPSNFLSPSKNLYFFSLAGNGIKQLPTDFFEGLEELTTVDLSDNKLTELNEASLKGLQNVDTLNLNGNQLKRLPPKIFHDMSSLSTLNLSDNQLEELDADLFPLSFETLHHLYLHNNRLTKLPRRFFFNTKFLNFVDLRNNRLTTIPHNCFEGMRLGESLADPKPFWRRLNFKLYLHGNPLVCDDKLTWLVEYVKAEYVVDTLWNPRNPRAGKFVSTCAAPEKHAGVALKDVKFD